MYQGQANKVCTGEVRLSYTHLSQPYAAPNTNNAPKYSVTLLIPKTDLNTKADIDSAIQAAIDNAVANKWNGAKPPVIPNPLHDGDGVKQNGESFGPECKGCWVMTAGRRPEDGKPYVCDISNVKAELLPQDIYSGMYARCTVHFYGYSYGGRKGVGCSIDGVMKTRDGEPLGGVIQPSANEFAQFATQDQAQINPITGQPM